MVRRSRSERPLRTTRLPGARLRGLGYLRLPSGGRFLFARRFGHDRGFRGSLCLSRPQRLGLFPCSPPFDLDRFLDPLACSLPYLCPRSREIPILRPVQIGPRIQCRHVFGRLAWIRKRIAISHRPPSSSRRIRSFSHPSGDLTGAGMAHGRYAILAPKNPMFAMLSKQ